MLNIKLKHFLLLFALAFFQPSFATVVQDDFTQPTDTNTWVPLVYACLTAGTTAAGPNNNTVPGNSVIPGCNYSGTGTMGLDAPGSGALRLTPAAGSQHGAIVSSFTFPTNQGLQATFTTYTYGGSHDGPGAEGADGLSFFLMDGSYGTTLPDGSTNLGSWGGSLAYTCSNVNGPYVGLTGGYLGLGMDEYGNFLNGGAGNDNTATGIPITADNTFTVGGFQQANRIGLRGAGSISWYWLTTNYPVYYPSTTSAALQLQAVQNACKTGTLWDYALATSENISAVAVSGKTLTVTATGVAGFNNGDSVTIAGVTATAAASSTITATSISGSTMTVTVPSTAAMLTGDTVTIGGTVTESISQPISSFSSYSSSAHTIRVSVATPALFMVGDSVTVSGVTGAGASIVNGTFAVTSIGSGYVTISTVSSNPGSVGTGSATITRPPQSVAGTYTITVLSSTAFSVNLSRGGTSVASTSGTVTPVAPTVPGTYTIANVTPTAGSATYSGTFQITLSGSAASASISSASVVNNTLGGGARQLATAIPDYAVIPGGFQVLPASKLIANEAASTRATAWPIKYQLTITPSGKLSLNYSYNGGAYQSVISNFDITTVAALPSSFRFGFAGSTGGSNNVHEITCFVAQPTESTSSAAANTVQSGKVQTGSEVYFASYNANGWTGDIVADALSFSGTVVSVASAADWDGNCVLTGATPCAVMTQTGPPAVTHNVTVEAPGDRQLLTWNGTTGVAFQYANMSSAQQLVLNSSDSLGPNRVNWMRGDRTQELANGGQLRTRGSVLGDIVDSSPTWVGPPSSTYPASFVDSLYAATGGETSYPSFKSSLATRQNIVYVGSDDGFLHGFRAGSYMSDGVTYNTANTTNDGKELIGFAPSAVFTAASPVASSPVVQLTNPLYGHNYFVDATPATGDLFYNGKWHTWLVGGMGPGGADIFALDITDPTGVASGYTAFSEANASSTVIGDWNPAALTAATCVNAMVGCGNNLGNTYGTPLIRRLHNGSWGFIFGNGFGSANNHAGIFIGVVKPTTGAITFYWLDTGSGSAAAPNGIAYPASLDLDSDRTVDYLYAGDLLGNVWRFDLTSSNPLDWGVSKYGQSSAAPLFTAKDSAGNVQPITTKITVSTNYINSMWQVILGVGTGRVFPFNATAVTTYATGTQTIYGLWDWDFAAWNAGQVTANSVTIPPSASKVASLPETAGPYRTYARADLLVNTLASAETTYRVMASSTVCWKGSSTCSGGATANKQYGWLFDLPDTNEQIIYSPIFLGGDLVVNTVVPPTNASAAQCLPALPTGWTMALSLGSGGGDTVNAFADSSGSFVPASSASSIVGQHTNAVGSPYVVTVPSPPPPGSCVGSSCTPTTCANDPANANCPSYCALHPTLPACTSYCPAHPTAPSCQTPAPCTQPPSLISPTVSGGNIVTQLCKQSKVIVKPISWEQLR